MRSLLFIFCFLRLRFAASGLNETDLMAESGPGWIVPRIKPTQAFKLIGTGVGPKRVQISASWILDIDCRIGWVSLGRETLLKEAVLEHECFEGKRCKRIVSDRWSNRVVMVSSLPCSRGYLKRAKIAVVDRIVRHPCVSRPESPENHNALSPFEG